MSKPLEISPRDIKQRIQELRGEVAQKRSELDLLAEELEWWEHGRRFFGESERPDRFKRTGQAAPVAEEKPTLRVAILRLMGERPQLVWPTKRILSELRVREWLPSGKNAEHTTRSMLAKMANRDELVRVGRGDYRLPPGDDET
jgi:hypothetical protein